MSDGFTVGDKVKFNVGKPDGPIFYGTVTRVYEDGRTNIQPDRPGYLGPGIKFHNITKVGPVKK